MAFRNCNLNINQVLTPSLPSTDPDFCQRSWSLALTPREILGPVTSSSQSSERVGVRAEGERREKRNPRQLSHSVQLFVLRGPSPRLGREQSTGGGRVILAGGRVTLAHSRSLSVLDSYRAEGQSTPPPRSLLLSGTTYHMWWNGEAPPGDDRLPEWTDWGEKTLWPRIP